MAKPEVRTPSGAETTPPGARPPAPPAPMPERWGHLRVIRREGGGAFGEVYRALDTTLDREVALKLLRPDRDGEVPGDLIVREAQNLARVRHPNVVMVYGADRHDGRVGLWMELISGQTAEDRLRERGPLGVRETVRIGRDVCRALAAVHAAGLVHRDVKAENVMIEAGGRVVLMDLGIGSGFRAGDDTRAAGPAGTPIYMAPETLKGDPGSVRSDVYGVGVLLFHLTTGSFPKREGGVRPPRAIARVVDRALAADPRDRFANAAEMERALAALERRRLARPIVAGVAAAAAIIAAAMGLAQIVSPSYSVEASFWRVREGEPDHELRGGDEVRVGDHVYLRLRTDHEVHAYVIDEDDAGSTDVLFPLAGAERRNPLPASDAAIELPGRSDAWIVTSAGQQEHFTVILRPEPDEEVERLVASLPKAEWGKPLALSAEQRGALRGLSHVGSRPGSKRTTTSRLFEDVTSFERAPSPERVRGRWARQLHVVSVER